MDISVAIEIKKKKLNFELNKKHPNKFIAHRLQESINRHQKEMDGMRRRRRKVWKSRFRKR